MPLNPARCARIEYTQPRINSLRPNNVCKYLWARVCPPVGLWQVSASRLLKARNLRLDRELLTPLQFGSTYHMMCIALMPAQPLMAERPQNLPDFKEPPVVEVVLGIQFATLDRFRSVHIGKLWEVFEKEFPKVQEHPPLNPAFEMFGSRPEASQLSVELLGGPPMPRVWFISAEETELIQFQTDRFLHNWRKTENQTTYPRYEYIRPRFFDEIDRFQKFLEDRDIGEISVNQCEITYVNHIDLGTEKNPHSKLGEIFNFWNDVPENHALPTFEDARNHLRYIISDPGGSPVGRLNVVAEPRRRNDGSSIIVLNLTARGKPQDNSISSVSQFLDLGRESVVRGFAALTTEKMHELWGKVQ